MSEQLIKDLQHIRCNLKSFINKPIENKSFSSNVFLEGSAYCILFETEIKFYFGEVGTVRSY